MKLIVVLARAMGAMERDLAPGIREAGITPAQFDVLESLHSLGPMTVNSLINKTLSSSGNTGVVVDNLIRSGLVRKETGEQDRRVRIIHLTGRGEKLIARLFPEHVRTLSDRLDVLSDSEVEDLTRLMKKLGKGRKGIKQ